MYLGRLWSVYEWKFDRKPRSMTSRDKTTQVFEMTSKMWSEEGLMNWLRIWLKEKNLECLLFVRSPTLAGRPHPQRFVPMDKIFFCEETNRSHLVWSTDNRILGSVLGLGFSFYGCLVFHVLWGSPLRRDLLIVILYFGLPIDSFCNRKAGNQTGKVVVEK